MEMMEDEDEFFHEDSIDIVLTMSLVSAMRRRYLFRKSRHRQGDAEAIYKEDLDAKEDGSDGSEATLPWLTESEFLSKYRLSRKNFHKILALIKDHPVFQAKGKKPQRDVAYQLMTWLKYAGTEGSGASNANQRGTFRIGYGTADVYRRRVTVALCSLTPQYYYWPDLQERQKIAKEILEGYGFPNCIGIADGSLHPLAFEPETQDAPDYSGRKFAYSMSTLYVCDNKRRIRHYLAGYPGSAHDNRIYKESRIFIQSEAYFEAKEYIIGDSAFQNNPHMVSAFKKPKGEDIPRDQEQFNHKLSQLRILSEHCIGILKGRFPWLKSIRFKIKEDPATIVNILSMQQATVTLHNILIDFGEEEKAEWYEEDDVSDIDDPSRVPLQEGDVLNEAIYVGAPSDERRRRLMFYFEEHEYFA